MKVKAHHNAELECGKQPAIPIRRKKRPESDTPNMIIRRLPHLLIRNVVIRELAIAKEMPISTIMAIWVGDSPACTRKYGPLAMKDAPITWDRPLQYRIMRVRRQLVPLKQSTKLTSFDSAVICLSWAFKVIILDRAADTSVFLLERRWSMRSALAWLFFTTR
jgi:hypothetical protein